MLKRFEGKGDEMAGKPSKSLLHKLNQRNVTKYEQTESVMSSYRVSRQVQSSEVCLGGPGADHIKPSMK